MTNPSRGDDGEAVEAAEAIVAAESTRILERATHLVETCVKAQRDLVETMVAFCDKMTPAIEQLGKLAEQIQRDEAETIAFMDDQMDY